MAAKDNEDAKSDDQDAEISLDMSQDAIKKMIAEAREKGYITYDQLNQVLPPDQVNSEQIEDVMSMLSEMGINIIEDEEAEEEEQAQKGSTEVVAQNDAREVSLASQATEKLDRTRPVVAVCDSGITSGKVVDRLRKAGFESAWGLKGGMNAWTQDGLPVVTGKKTRAKGRKKDHKKASA